MVFMIAWFVFTINSLVKFDNYDEMTELNSFYNSTHIFNQKNIIVSKNIHERKPEIDNLKQSNAKHISEKEVSRAKFIQSVQQLYNNALSDETEASDESSNEETEILFEEKSTDGETTEETIDQSSDETRIEEIESSSEEPLDETSKELPDMTDMKSYNEETMSDALSYDDTEFLNEPESSEEHSEERNEEPSDKEPILDESSYDETITVGDQTESSDVETPEETDYESKSEETDMTNEETHSNEVGSSEETNEETEKTNEAEPSEDETELSDEAKSSNEEQSVDSSEEGSLVDEETEESNKPNEESSFEEALSPNEETLSDEASDAETEPSLDVSSNDSSLEETSDDVTEMTSDAETFDGETVSADEQSDKSSSNEAETPEESSNEELSADETESNETEASGELSVEASPSEETLDESPNEETFSDGTESNEETFSDGTESNEETFSDGTESNEETLSDGTESNEESSAKETEESNETESSNEGTVLEESELSLDETEASYETGASDEGTTSEQSPFEESEKSEETNVESSVEGTMTEESSDETLIEESQQSDETASATSEESIETSSVVVSSSEEESSSYEPTPLPTATPEPIPQTNTICICVGTPCKCPDGLKPHTDEEAAVLMGELLEKAFVKVFVTGEGTASFDFEPLVFGLVDIEGVENNNVTLNANFFKHPKKVNIANLSISARNERGGQQIGTSVLIDYSEAAFHNIASITSSLPVSLTAETLSTDLITLASGFSSVSVTGALHLGGSFSAKKIIDVSFAEGALVSVEGAFENYAVGPSSVVVFEGHSYQVFTVSKARIFPGLKAFVRFIRSIFELEGRRTLELLGSRRARTDSKPQVDFFMGRNCVTTFTGSDRSEDYNTGANSFVIRNQDPRYEGTVVIGDTMLPISAAPDTKIALDSSSMQKAISSRESAKFANADISISSNDEVGKVVVSKDTMTVFLNDGTNFTIPRDMAKNVGIKSSNNKEALHILVTPDSGGVTTTVATGSKSMLGLQAEEGASDEEVCDALGSVKCEIIAESKEVELAINETLKKCAVVEARSQETNKAIDPNEMGLPGADGLPAGAIAGIVIACIVVVGVVVVVVIWFTVLNAEAPEDSETPDALYANSAPKKNQQLLEVFQYMSNLDDDDSSGEYALMNRDSDDGNAAANQTYFWNGNFW